jgi:hypothetical protein
MKALYMALAITAISAGQPVSGPIAGSWTAKFEGRTFIRLEMKTVNGGISGGMSLGNFEVDKQGVVRRADVAPVNLTNIFGATRKGSTVTFFRKDGNDTDQFELRLLENADADLHFLLNDEDRKELAASGVPLPKPIRVTKAH